MRPRIICHMVSSIDGRLLVRRWTPLATGTDPKLLHRQYEEVAGRMEADGWIVGRKSMGEMVKGAPAEPGAVASLPRATHRARADLGLAVAIDPKGRLHYAEGDLDGEHLVAVLGEDVPDAYLAELRDRGVSYLFAGPDGTDLGRALDELGSAFGARLLLLEGGGVTNGAFLKAGLIDEISLLVAPALDGLSGVPSIFDYLGAEGDRPAADRSLRLASHEALEGGTIWLRYLVEPAPE